MLYQWNGKYSLCNAEFTCSSFPSLNLFDKMTLKMFTDNLKSFSPALLHRLKIGNDRTTLAIRDVHERCHKASIKISDVEKVLVHRRLFLVKGVSQNSFIGKSFIFSCTNFGSTASRRERKLPKRTKIRCNKYFWRDLFCEQKKKKSLKIHRMFTGSLSSSLGILILSQHTSTTSSYDIFYNRFFHQPSFFVPGKLQYFKWWMYKNPWPEILTLKMLSGRRCKILFLMNQSIIQEIEEEAAREDSRSVNCNWEEELTSW